jgi:hypothetical protein
MVARVPSSHALAPGSDELTALSIAVVRAHNAGAPNRNVKPADRGRPGAWTLMPSRPAAVLRFRSHDAALVWIEECLGQISDGHYENRRGGMEFFKLGVAVDTTLVASGLEGRWEAPFRPSFAKLVELFDAADEVDGPRQRPYASVPFSEEARSDVRRIYSRLDDAALNDLLADIARAAGGAEPEAMYALRHADGRRCVVRNQANKLLIALTLEDGSPMHRERTSRTVLTDLGAVRDELLADGFEITATGIAAGP